MRDGPAFGPEPPDDFEAYASRLAEIRADHQVSWPWLLLPLIMTTAFVIFGAWRRAVRDAEVEEAP